MDFGFQRTCSAQVEMGEGCSLEAVCQRQRLSARASGPAWDPEAGRSDAGRQGPAIGPGWERSLPAGCFPTLFQPLASTCPRLHGPAKSSTHAGCLARTNRPKFPVERCLAAGIVSTVCGRTNFQGKIFGGQMAKPARWPWQASLLFRGSHICGGVLIDKNWVASAAHCFQRSRKPSDYRILLGYNNLGRPNNFSRQMTVNALIFHENYNKFYKQGSDIILIQLHKSVTYSSHILPACVPENTMNVPLDSSCWISGWGQLEEDKFLPAPFPLQEAEVLLVDDKECEEFFQTLETSPTKYKAIKEDMVCAGDISNERSICLGDSGGPLVCSLNGSWYVVGLASWSGACLEPVSSPNIFTKVSYFSDWIHNKKKETPDADPYLAPPEESAPTLVGWRSYGSDPATKPRVCVTLLSSQALLLPLIWLQIL